MGACKQPFNDTIAMKGMAATAVARPADLVAVLVIHETDGTCFPFAGGMLIPILIMTVVPG